MVRPTEDYDYFTYRGDSPVIKLSFKDINNQPINVTNFNIKFTVRDEYNDDDTIIYKTRIAGTPAGIITINDNASSTYNITADNQIAIVIDSDDTKVLRPDIYPFDVEFAKGSNIYTAIRGNLIVRLDMTRNV